PLPRSTPFPYTTLFRSGRDRTAGTAITLSVTVPNIDMLRVALEECQAGDILVVNARSITTQAMLGGYMSQALVNRRVAAFIVDRSEEHTSELQSRFDLV